MHPVEELTTVSTPALAVGHPGACENNSPGSKQKKQPKNILFIYVFTEVKYM